MSSNKFSLPTKFQKRLTNHAKKSLVQAFLMGEKLHHDKISNIHLLYSIYLEKNSLGSIIIQDLGIKKKSFDFYFKKTNSHKKSPEKNIFKLTTPLKKTLTRAYSVAKNMRYGYVGTEHLIYALLESDDEDIKKILATLPSKEKQKKNIKLNNLAQSSEEKSINQPNSFHQFIPQNFMQIISDFMPQSSFSFNDKLTSSSVKNYSSTQSETPFVDKFCLNINQQVIQEKEILIGRKEELARIINILGRKNKNNPLLIGHPGVGKTAIVNGLARLINSQQVPIFLAEKKIMSLDITNLIAGTSFRGEFETRLKKILEEVVQNKNIILFIDELHNIVGTGNVAGSLDLANIIKPALSQGDIRLIGTTTFTEYKKYIEKDSALERRFQPIQVKEPSKQETKKILLGVKKQYESFHHVSITPTIIDLTVELSQRYIKNRNFPDKAIDVIDEAAAKIRSKNKLTALEIKLKNLATEQKKLKQEKEKLINQEDYELAIQLRKNEQTIKQEIKLLTQHQATITQKEPIAITEKDIFKTVAQVSGIAEEKIAQTKNKKIKNISKILASQIIGQAEVITKITETLFRSQSGLENINRPLGSFLFMGPTGVGKTLTARVLAQEFFADANSLIRIDMSEFMERHNVASLIGSPAGYVGYGEGGRLTEQVRRNPYSVILFDEIEKAHPDTFNILLQILEDGILTDAEGLKVDFKNTLIILTTNIGTHYFTEASRIGFEDGLSQDVLEKLASIKEDSLKELKKEIKPEILNRLDYVLAFNPLQKKDLKKITALEIKKLEQTLKKQQITLITSPALINFIAQKSFALNQGARLIRKNIRELLENPIANLLVYDQVKDKKIKATIKNNRIFLA